MKEEGQKKQKASGVVIALTVVASILVLVIAVMIGALTYRFAMENLDLREPMPARSAVLMEDVPFA